MHCTRYISYMRRMRYARRLEEDTKFAAVVCLVRLVHHQQRDAFLASLGDLIGERALAAIVGVFPRPLVEIEQHRHANQGARVLVSGQQIDFAKALA